MIVEAYEDKHQIKQLEKSENEVGLRLKWRFKDASHFMMVIYDARKGLDMRAVADDMYEKSITPEKLINCNPRIPFYSGDDGIIKAFIISEAEFMNKERHATIPAKFFCEGIPYGIEVFACEYDVFFDYHELFLYLPRGEENLVYMPVKVQSRVSYKKSPFSKTKQCTVHVPFLEDYKDGAIIYRVEGVTGGVPLTSECLGKDITITVPAEATVTVEIADEDKKYYEIA